MLACLPIVYVYLSYYYLIHVPRDTTNQGVLRHKRPDACTSPLPRRSWVSEGPHQAGLMRNSPRLGQCLAGLLRTFTFRGHPACPRTGSHPFILPTFTHSLSPPPSFTTPSFMLPLLLCQPRFSHRLVVLCLSICSRLHASTSSGLYDHPH